MKYVCIEIYWYFFMSLQCINVFLLAFTCATSSVCWATQEEEKRWWRAWKCVFLSMFVYHLWTHTHRHTHKAENGRRKQEEGTMIQTPICNDDQKEMVLKSFGVHSHAKQKRFFKTCYPLITMLHKDCVSLSSTSCCICI